ncbi:MAG: sulfatase [Anaerolineae bacterium]|nr:sulfatase [Anaerolineae bacterium]
MPPNRPNVLFILADQLRASSLPLYGEQQISTPHLDRLAGDGVVLTNAVATCAVCTPYRSMLLTGRHPQTTGHVVNFIRTRHDEIGIGDALAHAGYHTAWVGKWHLHTGSFPHIRDARDYVPEGRDRLGFQHWRGYNFHMKYFDGYVNLDDWRTEQWQGYETDALARYACEFMDSAGEQPFCLFVSPHQPHGTPFQHAPEEYYARLPERLSLPENVPDTIREDSLRWYRNYLAMTLTVDDMIGNLLDYLDQTGRAKNTLVIFTSDHGSQVGAHGIGPGEKKMPYEESLWVPWIMRWPGVFEGGMLRDTLTAPVDIFPSLCGLCDVPVPRTVEGYDLSAAWRGVAGVFEQDAVFTMNFGATYDYLIDGQEWRGIRTKDHSYARWLNGKVELFDLRNDPLQMTNLADDPGMQGLRERMEKTLQALMSKRRDELVPCTSYRDWLDNYRRVVRNAFGPLGDPEDEPDWSLLT